MSLMMMGTAAMSRFDAICREVAGQGSGLTLQQISGAGALARELSKPDPDMTKVKSLRTQLGLEAEEIDQKANAPPRPSP